MTAQNQKAPEGLEKRILTNIIRGKSLSTNELENVLFWLDVFIENGKIPPTKESRKNLARIFIEGYVDKFEIKRQNKQFKVINNYWYAKFGEESAAHGYAEKVWVSPYRS